MQLIRLWIVTMSLWALSACSGGNGVVEDNKTQLAKRVYQTTVIENATELSVLKATLNTFQDLGYTITNSDTGLGLITVTKGGVSGNATVSKQGKSVSVRVVFRRGIQELDDATLYQRFFNQLNQALFIGDIR